MVLDLEPGAGDPATSLYNDILAVWDLAVESPLLETFQNCSGFTEAVLKTESCIMRAH